MTHDLISDMLSELDVSCTRVAVTELRENTFYAAVTLQLNGREIEIDSGPPTRSPRGPTPARRSSPPRT